MRHRWILLGPRSGRGTASPELGSSPGAALPRWAPSGNLPPVNVSLMLRPFVPLLGELHQLPHPALSTQRPPRSCSPMGSWMLSLRTRAPSPHPAGISSLLLGARRSFHYKFALVLRLSLGAAAGHCQTAGLAQHSSSSVSFNKRVWNRDKSLEKLVPGTPPHRTACLSWAYVWRRDEIHSAGSEAAAWRRLPAASEKQLMDQCCQRTLSSASWPVIGTWGCAVLL